MVVVNFVILIQSLGNTVSAFKYKVNIHCMIGFLSVSPILSRAETSLYLV